MNEVLATKTAKSKQAQEAHFGKSRGSSIVTVRMHPMLRQGLNELAQKRRVSLNTLCAELLMAEWERSKSKGRRA